METKTIRVLTKDANQLDWTFKDVSTLGDMQQIVGGYIECVSLPNHIDLWVNENGMIFGQELNLMVLWDKDCYQSFFGTVFLASSDDNGETTSLTESQQKWLAQHIALADLIDGRQVLAIDLREEGERS